MTDLSPNPAMNGGGKGAHRLPRGGAQLRLQQSNRKAEVA